MLRLWTRNEEKWYSSATSLYLFDKVRMVRDLTCDATATGGCKLVVVARAASSVFAGAVWNEKSE